MKPEVLNWFSLSTFSVPTVLYYQPKYNRFSELIGTFDFENIGSQEDKITISAFPAREAPLTNDKMILNKECAVVEQVQQPEEDEEFAAMLAEILAEEEA